MKPINVLSLFDGMSCGQIALEKESIPVKEYFASEIDKPAIAVTQSNYPNTKQLGDVCNVVSDFLPQIDLLQAGSPCQGFSFAGKHLNFDDPRSALFFEFVRLLKECKPKYFLLENVKMKKQHQDVISKYLGVEPIAINSSLFSAQERKRLYWTNIPFDPNFTDKGVKISDILDSVVAPGCDITDRYHKKIAGTRSFRNSRSSLRSPIAKTRCLLTAGQGISNSGATNILMPCGMIRKPSVTESERLQTVPVGYTQNANSKTQAYKMLGNGWTVDVIAHIYAGLKNALEQELLLGDLF